MWTLQVSENYTSCVTLQLWTSVKMEPNLAFGLGRTSVLLGIVLERSNLKRPHYHTKFLPYLVGFYNCNRVCPIT